MANFTVTRFESVKRYRHTGANSSNSIVLATVLMDDTGMKLDISRWSDEVSWTVDSIFLPNGAPYFVNGEGYRGVRTQRLKWNHPVAEELTKLTMAQLAR